jgi:hypothetical protein
MNGETSPTTALPKSKPAVKREHLLTMNSYDAWTLCDWAWHSSARLADLLSLPTWEVNKKYGL